MRMRMREAACLSHGEIRSVGGKDGATSPSSQNAYAGP